MPEPDWAELLNAYYQNGGWMWRKTLEDDSYPEFPTTNNLKAYKPDDMDHSQFYNIHNSLHRMGLVDSVEFSEIAPQNATPEEHVTWTRLTEKGFDVAHEREMVQRQDVTNQQAAKTNKRIAELTVVLASAAIVQVLASLFSAGYITNIILARSTGITVIISILVFLYLIFRA